MSAFHPRSLSIVLGAFFAALSAAVFLVGVLPADALLRDALLAWATPAVIRLMRIVNRAGEWRLLLPAMLLLLLLSRRARERWWLWLGLMIVAPITEGLLKVAIGRARPESGAFGFPSGHATAAAAFFGAILYLSGVLPPPRRRLVRTLAVAGIVLVGVARVVLRAHWPSDVVGGIALGLGFAAVAAMQDARARGDDPRLGERAAAEGGA